MSALAVCPPIVGLLKASCPLAILRRVTTVIILAIQRQSFWAFTHIGEKFGEAISATPAITDRDAPPAPIGVPSDGRIKAALEHVDPRSICAGRLLAHLVTMLISCGATRPTDHSAANRLAGYLTSKATTTLRLPILEQLAKDDGDLTAVATAFPCGSVADVWSRLKNGKPTESKAREVKLNGHRELTPSGVMRRAISAAPSPSILAGLMPLWKVATNKALEVDVVTAELDGTLTYGVVSV